MKKEFLILGLISLIAMGMIAAGQGMDMEVVAMVGDKIITNYDVEKSIRDDIAELPENLSEAQRQEAIKQLYDRGLESMIDYELAYLEFKAVEAKIPKSAVLKRLNSMVESRAGGRMDVFDDMLFRENMTRKELEEKLYKDIAVEAFIYDRVRRGTDATDEEIQQYFNEHQSEFVSEPEYLIQVIALKKENGRYTEEIGVEEAERHIRQRIANGDDFGELAKEFSESANAERGGSLGWQKKMIPILQSLVKYMKPGDVSGNTLDNGKYLYIFKLADYRPGSGSEVTEEISAIIKRRIIAQKEKEKYDKLFDQLEKKFNVVRMNQ